MAGRNPISIRAEWALTRGYVRQYSGPIPRGPGCLVLAWWIQPTSRCAALWPAIATEGWDRDTQQETRAAGFPQPDVAAILDAILLEAGCVSTDVDTVSPCLRFVIRVAGRPRRDAGVLPGSTVALLYRQPPGAHQFGPPCDLVARFVYVADVERPAALWLAVELREVDSPAMQYVFLALTAAFNANSRHWSHTYYENVTTPSLGRGTWVPSMQHSGPNLFGSWFRRDHL